MGVRRKRKDDDGGTDPLLAQLGEFRCGACSRPLQLELLVCAEVERRDGAATGFVGFVHYCACSPDVMVESRALGSSYAFTALFGGHPKLPYLTPFCPQTVPENDPEMARWGWELAQVADVGEFLLFAEDAAARRPRA
ncbi:MAG: hypothetical protein AB1673_12225 [Actinomycetota bacterium]|jgi:hypothetical protein